MTNAAKTIHVDGDTSLAEVLTEADGAPVRLTTGDAVYRVTREEADAPLRVDAIKDAVDATTGSWGDLDVGAIIDDIYRARDEGTRPATRP